MSMWPKKHHIVLLSNAKAKAKDRVASDKSTLGCYEVRHLLVVVVLAMQV